MIKHFVEFFYPNGYFWKNHNWEEIAERTHELVNVPEGASGYRFYDQEYDNELEILIGECINYSGCTYFGKIYTLEEVKSEFPEEGEFISEMENYGCDKAVRIRSGNWSPLIEGDTVIEV